MKRQSWLVTAAVVLSAALINPAESAAQRQRSPGNGGGRQDRQDNGGGGGGRQREGGGNGGGRQRDDGGGRPRDNGGARPQGDGGRAEVRSAQPRERAEPIDRGDRVRRDSAPPPQSAQSDGQDRSRAIRRVPTEAPPAIRESGPPPQPAQSDGQDRSRAIRRVPTEADRDGGERGNGIRERGDRATLPRDDRDRVRGTGNVRGNTDARVRDGGARVAVPRTGPLPRVRDGRDGRDGRDLRGYNVYRNYGGRNVYVVPRGRTYVYYPRYYYRPYTFGYGPAGRGHFYFDLYYNSYIWHPYSVYRYGSYGSYGYPVGELRLKVHPRDAQVFIDGYYAGRVDDFDGVFQSLRLEEGEYQVEIVLPGYEPLAFDVRIFPGEKTTYEGDLIPELP
jgi:hypothetical protein